MHPARYAFAAPSGTATAAKSFFDSGYFPIENSFWAINSIQESIYRTSLLRSEMQRFVSLQVYATAAWARPNPYSDRRIALAWNQQTSSALPLAAHQALAMRLALALEGAYSQGGSPAWACDPNNGASVALCTVPASRYGVATPPDWSIFKTWP